MATRFCGIKKKPGFVRNQKDALSAEVKNIHEKARRNLQELVDEVTGDLQSSAPLMILSRK